MWGLDLLSGNALHVREERVPASREKPAFSILLISDLHLGAPGWKTPYRQLLEISQTVQCDVVLLAGDLVERHSGWDALRELIQHFAARSAVGVIDGNHDRWAGESLQGVVVSAGGTWLRNMPLVLHQGERVLRVCGADRQCTDSSNQTSVLCVHDPRDATRDTVARHQLVVAGHLHGRQCVFFEKNGALYPGALFNRLTRLRWSEHGTTYVVSRGVHDTLPIRWRCPREVVLCHI